MPLTTWDKAQFDQAYNVPNRGGARPGENLIMLGYTREAFLPAAQRKAQAYIQHCGLTAATRALIIGGGFGWSAEFLAAAGIPVVVTDTSPYIQSDKAASETTEYRAAITAAGIDPDSPRGAELLASWDDGQAKSRVTVLGEDCLSDPSRNAVRQAFGNNDPDWIITEDVVTSMSTADVTAARAAWGAFTGAQFCHVITPLRVGGGWQDTGGAYNWQSIEDWAALLPGDLILNAHNRLKPV